MGFQSDLFDHVMTSGEALWIDIHDQRISERSFFAIERNKGDAQHWGSGLDIELTQSLQDADAVLLMGLPDGSIFVRMEKVSGRRFQGAKNGVLF